MAGTRGACAVTFREAIDGRVVIEVMPTNARPCEAVAAYCQAPSGAESLDVVRHESSSPSRLVTSFAQRLMHQVGHLTLMT